MFESALSFAEEQLWLADQPGSTAFPFIDCTRSLSVVVRLEHSLNRQALQCSLDDIVRRHDVLRSTFVARQGRPQRLMRRSSSAALQTIDLRCAGDDRQALVTRVLEEHVSRPFDLTRGPLLRAVLLSLADDDHVLAITVHHIVFDRWSKRVLARELKQFYEAYASGRTPVVEPLRSNYGDYVQWQRQQLDGPFSRELVAYWTAQLAGLSDVRLSGDLDCECVTSTRGGKWSFAIPEQDASRLDAMSRRCRVTLTTVLLAMFTLFLGRLSELDDVAVGVPLPDRRRPDFEPLIGLFANVVVVRTAIARGTTFLELLQRVRRALFDACRYQDLPYGQLLRMVGAQTPLHRIVFNFLSDIPASDVGLAGLRVTPLQVGTEHPAVADLSLHVRRQPAGLACRLVYKADRFSASWAQAFAAQFQTLITAVLDEPQKEVGAWRTH